MPHTIRHFSLNCNDVQRARRFYQSVFGWTSKAWGPPGFYQVDTGGLPGALQRRREIVPGRAMVGFECTVGVDDIDATEKAVLAAGGKIVMPKVGIANVGTLLFFEDPEGNIVGAMQYEASEDAGKTKRPPTKSAKN